MTEHFVYFEMAMDKGDGPLHCWDGGGDREGDKRRLWDWGRNEEDEEGQNANEGLGMKLPILEEI